jgi:membrane protein implicated in regulation of membrane protease activity
MLAGPVFAYPFATGKFRVEARNLIIGHAKANDVPTPADAMMELRGGAVTTILNGQTQERIEGDFWTVEKGSHLDIENKGQVAVIRAVYVYPGAK